MNENFSTIGFLTDIEYQVANIPYNYAGVGYQNIMPTDKLIPHSFSAVGTLTSALLISTDAVDSINITAQYTTEAKIGYNIFYNLGTVAPAGMTRKEYYVQYTISGQTYFSDYVVFGDASNLMSLEWWHSADGDEFIYDRDDAAPETATGSYDYTNFGFNKIYFNDAVKIARPSYQFEDNIEQRLSTSYPITQTSFKLNKFTALLPEYIIDVLRLVRLHTNIAAVNYLGKQFVIKDFLMADTPWIDEGVLASVEFEFRSGSVSITHARSY